MDGKPSRGANVDMPKAQVIVTFNLRDFPEDKLSPSDVQAVHPNAFVEAQVDLAPQIVYAELQRIRTRGI